MKIMDNCKTIAKGNLLLDVLFVFKRVFFFRPIVIDKREICTLKVSGHDTSKTIVGSVRLRVLMGRNVNVLYFSK
jgi:hypothetical protein